MKTIEYRFIDKSTWGDGSWQSEPDKVQYPDPDTGLPCLAVRHMTLGHWCGYVGVAEGHPYYQQDYGEIPDNVHGGLTFADMCRPDPTEHGICHVAGEGEADRVWWLGFDCAHADDMSPGNEILRKHGYGIYRTLEYVKAECANLARQLSEVAK